MGRQFHRRGAAEQKARSPMVRSLVTGTWSRNWFADLRVRVEVGVSVYAVICCQQDFVFNPG